MAFVSIPNVLTYSYTSCCTFIVCNRRLPYCIVTYTHIMACCPAWWQTKLKKEKTGSQAWGVPFAFVAGWKGVRCAVQRT